MKASSLCLLMLGYRVILPSIPSSCITSTLARLDLLASKDSYLQGSKYLPNVVCPVRIKSCIQDQNMKIYKGQYHKYFLNKIPEEDHISPLIIIEQGKTSRTTHKDVDNELVFRSNVQSNKTYKTCYHVQKLRWLLKYLRSRKTSSSG